MQGGDISNGIPPRFLVHVDVITVRSVENKRILGLFNIPREKTYFDRRALAQMWLFWQRSGATLELFGTECTQPDMDDIVTALDSMGTNPFRYATAYKTAKEVVDELPYRGEVQGVIDLPERAFFYGSYYFDLARV